MRLLADVHVKSSYLTALRSHGHHVVRVQDVMSRDAPDTDIVDRARVENLVVLTNDDKDFGQFDSHAGVLFVPQDMRPGDVETAVSRIEHQFDDLVDEVQYLKDWS